MVSRKKQPLRGYSEYTKATGTAGIASFLMDVGGYVQKMFAYVVPGLDEDVFLGKPWLEDNDVVYYAKEKRLRHRKGKITLRF